MKIALSLLATEPRVSAVGVRYWTLGECIVCRAPCTWVGRGRPRLFCSRVCFLAHWRRLRRSRALTADVMGRA